MDDEQLAALMAHANPAKVRDADELRATTGALIDRLPVAAERARAKRLRWTIAAAIGGVVVLGTTAAAVPTIWNAFGRIDYQSTQEYTVDGYGPYRCEFVFRVNPTIAGESGRFAEIQQFVSTNDWRFDDSPVALISPPDSLDRLGVMSGYVHDRWLEELTERFPDYAVDVSSVESAGTCVSVADGSTP